MLTTIWTSIVFVFILLCQFQMVRSNRVGFTDLIALVGPLVFHACFSGDFWGDTLKSLIAMLSPLDDNPDVVTTFAYGINFVLFCVSAYASLFLMILASRVRAKWLSRQHSGPNRMVSL